MAHLTRSPIALDDLLRCVASPERGGTCFFIGTVRNRPGDRDVTGIEYTAYAEMAEAELQRILAETRERWADVLVAVTHRLGFVPVGDASIAIAAAAPHRADAFASCRYAIEQVKARLPVWKCEHRADGSKVWVDPAGQVVEVP